MNTYDVFELKAYKISFHDSRQNEEVIFWMKKDSLNELFTEPRKYDVVDVVSEKFLKQDFDNSRKDISINKKRIGSFKSIDMENSDFQDWVCYKTGYNLKGRVIASAYQRQGAGYYLKIESSYAGQKIHILYMHLQQDSMVVKQGDWVSAGQNIASMGQTGTATGPHLHFEIRVFEKAKWITKDPMLWNYKYE